jgi:polysaccharide export outer membrane protein
MKKNLYVLLVIIFTTFSCVPVEEMTYLQTDKEAETQTYEVGYDEYIVGYNDILYISIKTDQKEYLEQPQTGFASDASFYLTGYTVDKNGYIDLPLVGEVYVFGSTIAAIKDRVTELMSSYYKNYVVKVKPTGVKVSILGEVGRPGSYTFYQNNVTIFDLLAKSGDLRTYANRKKVQILRHKDDNVTVHYVDLTRQDIFTSDFYYLQPEDVVYIKPLGVKSWGIGTTGFNSIQVITSILSSVFLIVNVVNK